MHLLLIFALTFTLSMQTDNTDNADAESTVNDNKDNHTETKTDNDNMMEKVMSILGEEGLMHLMSNLGEKDLAKAMECMEKKCSFEDLADMIPNVINCMKTFNGGKSLCALVKAFVPDGPMARMVNQMKEEDMIKMINSLDSNDIKMLLTIGSGPLDIMKLMKIGKKIFPILMKSSGGNLSNLIAMFTNGKGEKKNGGGGLSELGGGDKGGLLGRYLFGAMFTNSKGEKKNGGGGLSELGGGGKDGLFGRNLFGAMFTNGKGEKKGGGKDGLLGHNLFRGGGKDGLFGRNLFRDRQGGGKRQGGRRRQQSRRQGSYRRDRQDKSRMDINDAN